MVEGTPRANRRIVTSTPAKRRVVASYPATLAEPLISEVPDSPAQWHDFYRSALKGELLNIFPSPGNEQYRDELASKMLSGEIKTGLRVLSKSLVELESTGMPGASLEQALSDIFAIHWSEWTDLDAERVKRLALTQRFLDRCTKNGDAFWPDLSAAALKQMIISELNEYLPDWNAYKHRVETALLIRVFDGRVKTGNIEESIRIVGEWFPQIDEVARGMLLDLFLIDFRSLSDSSIFRIRRLQAAQAESLHEKEVILQREQKAAADAEKRFLEEQLALRLKKEKAAKDAEKIRQVLDITTRIARALQQLARREGIRASLFTRLEHLHNSDFPNSLRLIRCETDSELLSQDEISFASREFVRAWAARRVHIDLDDDQAAAVAAIGANIRVRARAGSGKTSVLVTRARFLQEHCRVDPSEILVLAFNVKAVKEIEKRLTEFRNSGPASFQERKTDSPNVMTFHALARALSSSADLITDNEASDQMGVSRAVKEAIGLVCSSPSGEAMVRKFFLTFFRPDSTDEDLSEEDFSDDEYRRWRRGLKSESLNGDYIKSRGELLIANALFENDVDYRYELARPWGQGDARLYRPDFTILKNGGKKNIALEFFGMEGKPEYDEQIERKRDYWARFQNEVAFVECFPPDIYPSSKFDEFISSLLSKLDELEIPHTKLSEDEIWAKVKDRSLQKLDGVVAGFIQRCRTLDMDGDDLSREIAEHTPISAAENLFLAFANLVYRAYLQRLEDEGKIEFSGLLWSAVSKINEGPGPVQRGAKEPFELENLKYILVDEFQDFSKGFFEVLTGIQRLSPEVEIFAVGDDWQSINGFAGSDLRYFEDFEKLFSNSKTLTMARNYRSAPEIVAVGNAVMAGLGLPGVPCRAGAGVVAQLDLSDFTASVSEKGVHGEDLVTPALLRLVSYLVLNGHKVTILSRKNEKSPAKQGGDGNKRRTQEHLAFLEHLLQFLPNDFRQKVTFSTSHSFKGKEQDAIIALGVKSGEYPFIHPTWEFGRIFGDSLETLTAESRRLLYVALTRAKNYLFILTDSSRPTPFLAGVSALNSVSRPSWELFPPRKAGDQGFLEIRLKTRYEDRAQNSPVLLKLGYVYDAALVRWCMRKVLQAKFNFEEFQQGPVIQRVISFEIFDDDGTRIYFGNGSSR